MKNYTWKNAWEKYCVMRGNVDTWKKDGRRLWFCYSRWGWVVQITFVDRQSLKLNASIPSSLPTSEGLMLVKYV